MAPPRYHLAGERRGYGGTTTLEPRRSPAGRKEKKSQRSLDRTGLAVAGQTKEESPSPLAHLNSATFFPRRSLQLPRLRPLPGSNHSTLLILLLLLTGRCPNPGPIYPCGVCDANVTWRSTSYLCTSCRKWVHARCSGLTRSTHYVFDVWCCPACSAVSVPDPPQAPPPPVSLPPAPAHSLPAASAVLGRPVNGHFLQVNINGILNSHQQLLHFLRDKNILIACVQETKLTATSALPAFPNYAVIRRDRLRGRGGGLIILVHHSITYQELPDTILPGDSVAERQTIAVEVNGATLTICNIYIPPATSCPPGYSPDFHSLFNHTEDILIMGDFNAHDDLWYSSNADTAAADRGARIVEALDSSTLMVINQDSPTRMPSNGPSSSPDLTVTNSHLGLNASWHPITTLNSDHLPIIVDLDGWFAEPPSLRIASYTNFRKADWQQFTSETEQAFSDISPPSSCDAGEKQFRRILIKASRRNIPRGKIPNFTPGLTQLARDLISERDDLRATDPANDGIPLLETRLAREIARRKQEIWRETVESCFTKRCSGKYFKILRNLSGKRSLQDPNQPMTFEGKVFSDRRKIAMKFAKQFTRPSPHAHDPSTRRLIRLVHRRFPLERHAAPFTDAAVQKAIHLSKNSTAPSADGLTIHQLKHLGPRGIQYLTALFNLSHQHANLPAIWKHAIILPILKPGKPKDQGTSYRPISILCPASKVLEKLVYQRIAPLLQLADTQHGFRPGRSTSTALLPLVQRIVAGFNQQRPPRRTVAMAVDFSKAFDTVNHTALLRGLLDANLPSNDIK